MIFILSLLVGLVSFLGFYTVGVLDSIHETLKEISNKLKR